MDSPKDQCDEANRLKELYTKALDRVEEAQQTCDRRAVDELERVQFWLNREAARAELLKQRNAYWNHVNKHRCRPA